MKPDALLKMLSMTLALVLIAPVCFAGKLEIHDAPRWVNDGTTYATMQGDRFFHGVGLAPPVGDPELQLAICGSRAIMGWMLKPNPLAPSDGLPWLRQ